MGRGSQHLCCRVRIWSTCDRLIGIPGNVTELNIPQNCECTYATSQKKYGHHPPNATLKTQIHIPPAQRHRSYLPKAHHNSPSPLTARTPSTHPLPPINRTAITHRPATRSTGFILSRILINIHSFLILQWTIAIFAPRLLHDSSPWGLWYHDGYGLFNPPETV